MDNKKYLAVGITIAFSIIGVVGDYFLKLASQEERTFRSPWVGRRPAAITPDGATAA